MNASRKRDILKLFDRSEALSVKDLAAQLGCSESSVRRDLIDLDKQGLLTKVHGGAVRIADDVSVEDKELAERMALFPDDKRAVAAVAAQLIEEGDVVYLDAGTTVSFVIDALTVRHATFVTNSHPHAERLAARGYTVYVIGGEFKAKTGAYVGALATKILEQYHFSIGLFGTNGISTSVGFSTPDEREAAVKHAALSRCDRAYILSDHSKFNRSAFVSFAALSDAVVVTDSAPEGWQNLVRLITPDSFARR